MKKLQLISALSLVFLLAACGDSDEHGINYFFDGYEEVTNQAVFDIGDKDYGTFYYDVSEDKKSWKMVRIDPSDGHADVNENFEMTSFTFFKKEKGKKAIYTGKMRGHMDGIKYYYWDYDGKHDPQLIRELNQAKFESTEGIMYESYYLYVHRSDVFFDDWHTTIFDENGWMISFYAHVVDYLNPKRTIIDITVRDMIGADWGRKQVSSEKISILQYDSMEEQAISYNSANNWYPVFTNTFKSLDGSESYFFEEKMYFVEELDKKYADYRKP